jgi:DNA helicase-2/ATP-dependent DNA helicase PcrA
MPFTPRPKQAEVLAYTGGKMGVSAAPGSGKTHVLSALAARLVADGGLADDQEVLIVTLVNSAVDNFSSRVDEFIKERHLLPRVGYRVRTLHGLAHDIVRERPGLLGLAEDFRIADEQEAAQILQGAVSAWLAANPDALLPWGDPALDDRRLEWVKSDPWPELVGDIAGSFIRMAKDLQLTPEVLADKLQDLPRPAPLMEMGVAIYRDYQRSLAYRAALDYDDLIRLALNALRADPDYLQRLRYRWPFVLEDEAQDSSRLQEEILRLLVGPDGNWVRVGDPNQAIFETFTTASPRYLREFLDEEGVTPRSLPNSGRSTLSIIRLANLLVEWARHEHPVRELRDALAGAPIEPAPPGDPQPNPPDNPDGVRLAGGKYAPDKELEGVIKSVAKWLPEHSDETVAIITPSNHRGFDFEGALKARGIEYVGLLRSTRETRTLAGALGNILNALAEPADARRLTTAYKVWRRRDREDPDAVAVMTQIARVLERCRNVEEYLWPRPESEDLSGIELPGPDPIYEEQLRAFRAVMRRWQGAATLPIDQLLITIGQDIFEKAGELALTHKLAGALRMAAAEHPAWRLPELIEELATIARNERKFLGFSDDDTGFNPDAHKGKVAVVTAHKAKGLEWDRVYLTSVNAYDFPSAQAGDSFISEKWFIRNKLNLQAEALAQLEALAVDAPLPPLGQPTEDARIEYAAERLRLLYVGITRARKELIMTSNTGRSGKVPPAVPFIALQELWQAQAVEEA